jgi:uncharacterized protein YndB with AHSA1/START domain
MTETRSDPLGTLELRGNRHVLTYERRLHHPVESVWASLTEPDELIAWWGEANVDLTEGGRFGLRWLNTDEEGNGSVLETTITDLEPQRRLVLTGAWGSQRPDWGSADELSDPVEVELRWELEPAGDGTVLRFECIGELPEDYLTKTLAGWHWHLDALERALGGGSTDLADPQGWESIHERYEAASGATRSG